MRDVALTDQEQLNLSPFCPGEASGHLRGLSGREPYDSSSTCEVKGLRGEVVARAARAPRLLQGKMVQQAAACFPHLRTIPQQEWFDLLERAGRFLIDEEAAASSGLMKASVYARLVSETTGLPEVRVRRALSTLADELARMAEILTTQLQSGNLESLINGGGGANWLWSAAGRHVAVRVPSNFPTINITWLMALALRRPVLLCASAQDPFTPLLLAEALYKAGLPDGAVSLCFEESQAFWSLADQVLWPGDLVSHLSKDSRRVQHYHHGRSKAIIPKSTTSTPANLWTRLAHMVVRGCGRLCTNLSTLLVEGGKNEAAGALAEALAAFPILPLKHPQAIVPAFSEQRALRQIAALIEEAVARGAVDITEWVTGMPLIQERDGLLFLRPTVLQLEADDPLYGAELPFPFVTVTESPRAMLAHLCRESLVVSLAGEEPDLLEELLQEPTIDKVFHGDQFDRDYDPTDPHEGYLVDFLFRKKAVWPKPLN